MHVEVLLIDRKIIVFAVDYVVPKVPYKQKIMGIASVV